MADKEEQPSIRDSINSYEENDATVQELHRQCA